ncbi:MAG: HU family DNA-binding protein [Desulforhopalus sp.]|nr:HU family DNA-binding protein [Desulforhopalus sp.]
MFNNACQERLSREEFMNKKELIESIAGAADISKAAAEKALNGTLAAVAESLKKGDKVTLVGFGTFSISKRDARQGRNPQTGKTIKIPAKKIVKFKAGSKLSEAIN